MPTSILEWGLFLSLLPFYVWWSWTNGYRLGYWAGKKLLGVE
jgi:hypothetical protein